MYEEILSRVIEALEYCDKDPLVTKGILKEIREVCEREICNSQAKAKGSTEVKRKKAAEATLKNVSANREWMNGYVEIGEDFILPNYETLKDGIILTDGYIMYIGKPITGIKKIEDERGKDLVDLANKLIDNKSFDTNTETVDIAELKSNLKIAKAEAKARGIKKEHICEIREACLITHDKNGNNNAVFDADKVIKACEMLGGDKWTITSQTATTGAFVEGENGVCIVMPMRPKNMEWLRG